MVVNVSLASVSKVTPVSPGAEPAEVRSNSLCKTGESHTERHHRKILSGTGVCTWVQIKSVSVPHDDEIRQSSGGESRGRQMKARKEAYQGRMGDKSPRAASNTLDPFESCG